MVGVWGAGVPACCGGVGVNGFGRFVAVVLGSGESFCYTLSE